MTPARLITRYTLLMAPLLLAAFPAHAQSVFSMATGAVQAVLDPITENLYRDFVTGLQGPVQIFMTLFIICYAILFATGILKHTTKEFTVIMFKLALVFAFALDTSGWAVGLIQGFFMGIVNTGSSLVLSGITGNPLLSAVHSGAGDGLAAAALNLARGLGGCGIGSFVFLLLFAFFPLLSLFGLFLLTFFFAFISAIFGFITSLVMIAILSAFAPFFVPMALFKFTSKMFEQWLKMLVANSIQVILVFAFIGFVVRINPFSVLTSLSEVVVPYSPAAFFGLFTSPWPLCTVCQYSMVGGSPVCNTPLQPIPLTQLALHPEFYIWAMTGLFSIVALGWALLQIFREVPTMAKSLSGAFYMGIGGGLMAMGGASFGMGGGGISMPGEERWAAALQSANRQVGRTTNPIVMNQLANRAALLNPFLSEQGRNQRQQRGLQLEQEREKFEGGNFFQRTEVGRVSKEFWNSLRYGAQSHQYGGRMSQAQQDLILAEQRREEAMLRLEEAARERKEREEEELRLRRQREARQGSGASTDAELLDHEAQDAVYMKAQLAAAEARATEQAVKEELEDIRKARAVYERASRGLTLQKEEQMRGIFRNDHEGGDHIHSITDVFTNRR